jgi:hypothetical protein
MKWCAIIAFALTGCASVPLHSLPTRSPTGNHGQGQSPAADCPHQYKEFVTTPDGNTVFIYCWGKRYQT